MALVWVLGAVAETWLKRAGWLLLAVIALLALLGARTMNRRIQADVQRWAVEHPDAGHLLPGQPDARHPGPAGR